MAFADKRIEIVIDGWNSTGIKQWTQHYFNILKWNQFSQWTGSGPVYKFSSKKLNQCKSIRIKLKILCKRWPLIKTRHSWTTKGLYRNKLLKIIFLLKSSKLLSKRENPICSIPIPSYSYRVDIVYIARTLDRPQSLPPLILIKVSARN